MVGLGPKKHGAEKNMSNIILKALGLRLKVLIS